MAIKEAHMQAICCTTLIGSITILLESEQPNVGILDGEQLQQSPLQ
jgi:hypothetical protein